MTNGNCAVVGCTNSNYRLKKWRKEQCEIHAGSIHQDCPCVQPFWLHKFPSVLKNQESRKEWTRLMKRTNKRNTSWTPGESDMVCSKHFVDGMPTVENPNPTLNLGYELPAKKARRTLAYNKLPPQSETLEKSKASHNEMDCEDSNTDNPLEEPESLEKEGQQCEECPKKSCLIGTLVNAVKSLAIERDQLKASVADLSQKHANHIHQKKQEAKAFSWTRIKSDAKMKFYTGIQSIKFFNALCLLILPCLPKIVYWRGKKNIVSTKYKRTATKRSIKVTEKNQFLLVLMRLRLGLFNEDLADRFGISEGTCSSIFTTWVRLLSKLLGNALIVWLPKEAVYSNLPKMFHEKYRHARCIIDCTEVYIERPKSLNEQAATWSDYKKHNTLKFLVCISPNGFIMYLSDCYGGRTSDQYICQDSNFYKFLDYGDEVLADRGFQIKEDLLLYYCKLFVPPGARAKAQMSAAECKKTKEIANVRIHVERAINRLKEFKILKNVMPVNMLPHADAIIRTCGALCNLQPPLIK